MNTEYLLIRVKNLTKEEAAVHSILSEEAPKIIDGMMKYVSLREIGRRCGLSPTYLSMVLNRKQVISRSAFITLVELMNPMR